MSCSGGEEGLKKGGLEERAEWEMRSRGSGIGEEWIYPISI